MEVPWLNAAVVKVATPETREPDPITTLPLRNLIVPEGAVVPLAGFTVATKVIGEFCVMLVADATRVVVVFTAVGAAGFTVIATIVELEALNATPPE